MTLVGDLLEEFKERPRRGEDLPVLTLTEQRGFLLQSERFKKRLATEDTSLYKRIGRLDFAFNPYLLWAGAIAQNSIVEAGVISPLYPTFRVRPGVDARYVNHMLLSAQMVTQYDGIAFGSVPRRRRSSVRDFLSLPVRPLPSLVEQKRVAERLDQAESLKRARESAISRLESLESSAFHQANRRDAGSLTKFGDLCRDLRNGLSPSSVGRIDFSVLTLSALTRGKFDPTSKKLGKFEKMPPAKVRVRAGDFLICRGNGNRDLVGAGVVVPDSCHDLAFPDTVIAATLREDLIDPLYLAAAWRQESVRSQILAGIRTTSGIFKVNQKMLSEVVLNVPTRESQAEFVRTGRVVDELLLRYSSARASEEKLVKALHDQAFAGAL